MFSARAMLIKFINKGFAFIIAKTKPFPIQLGTKILETSHIIFDSKYDSSSSANICSITKCNWDNHGGFIINNQFKIPKVAEARRSPIVLPFHFFYFYFAPSRSFHYRSIFLICRKTFVCYDPDQKGILQRNKACSDCMDV